jgi:hypothetical protein
MHHDLGLRRHDEVGAADIGAPGAYLPEQGIKEIFPNGYMPKGSGVGTSSGVDMDGPGDPSLQAQDDGTVVASGFRRPRVTGTGGY